MNKCILIKDSELNLDLKESSVLTLLIENSEVNINYSLKDGDYKILVVNNSKSDLVINETGKVINSNVEINYIELNDYKLKQNNKIEVYKGSTLNINTTYLGINKKDIEFNLRNNESESNTNIVNNVVAMDESDFTLKVTGKILKGSKSSKAHQKSRCLTLGSPKKAKVFPILEIDENDVEASHSLSSGTIDEEVLFYMNTRGLNKKEAISLLLVSYLMPNEDFYSIYPEGKMINELANSKVENICSI